MPHLCGEVPVMERGMTRWPICLREDGGGCGYCRTGWIFLRDCAGAEARGFLSPLCMGSLIRDCGDGPLKRVFPCAPSTMRFIPVPMICFCTGCLGPSISTG